MSVVLPKISDPPTSELLRRRVLAVLNVGASSTEEIRNAVQRKARAA